jgi:hypothetical protein
VAHVEPGHRHFQEVGKLVEVLSISKGRGEDGKGEKRREGEEGEKNGGNEGGRK